MLQTSQPAKTEESNDRSESSLQPEASVPGVSSSQSDCFRPDYGAGDRTYGVGWGGVGQWLADINGDGRADFVYNRSSSHEYRVLLSRQDLPYSNGVLKADKSAGFRNSGNNVGWGGLGQWMADVNGDGRADYIYNRDKKHEYWVMLGQSDGTFGIDTNAGSRNANNNVAWRGLAQWMADVNGDGRADYVYSRDRRPEYWIMLGQENGSFATDMYAGSRFTDNGVARSGLSQWMADVNGDGRADYVYNKDGTSEYWVMLGKEDGTFHTDTLAGTRNNSVDSDGKAQWLVDVTGDGRADLVYNMYGTGEYRVMVALSDGTFGTDSSWGTRAYDIAYGIDGVGLAQMNWDGRADLVYQRNDTKEYWVKLSTGSGFQDDALWGTINNKPGWSNKGSFLSDVTGDGLADLLYNSDRTNQRWVAISCNPLQPGSPPGGGIQGPIRHLDVWGQGYIVEGNIVTGFQDSTNLDMRKTTVSNGGNRGMPIPNLIPVDCTYANCRPPLRPVFPIASGSVEIMTSMGAPIFSTTAQQMYDAINKEQGIIVLYGHTETALQAFVKVFVTEHGWSEVPVQLNYPFNLPSLSNMKIRAYSPKNSPVTVGYGKGGRVGGVGRSKSTRDSPAGGADNRTEL